jgi:ectoine hydroxylase-related dioxygenase (phytanoyl-CoA dioxygenase family)
MYKKAINNIKKNGYHIFKSVLNKKDQLKYLNTVKKLKTYNQAGFFDNKSTNRKMILNLQTKNMIFLKLLNNKLINKINTYFLNDKLYKNLSTKQPNYNLNQYAATASGKEKLILHIDDMVPNSSDNVNFLQWMIPLVKMDKNNGCTQVVPKTHKSGILKPILKKNNKLVNLDLDIGDMAVIDGRIWHCSEANKTNEDRWLIVITYCKWFFKPAYDIPRSFPKKFMNKLNNNLKIILGFASIPKFSEKRGLVQRGDLTTANKFLKNRIY